MKETTEELDGLQRLLDASIAASGAYLIAIVSPGRRLSARQLVADLTGTKVLVVATVTASAQPRTSAVDGHFLHGNWIFHTSAKAHKARHLRARPAISATHADGERMAVFVHGHAECLTPQDARFSEYDEYYVGHYGFSPPDWGPTPVFVRIHPIWMIGYAMNAAHFPDG